MLVVGDHFIEFRVVEKIEEGAGQFKLSCDFDGGLIEGGLGVSDKNNVGVGFRLVGFKHGR